jgi:hypothetical protein
MPVSDRSFDVFFKWVPACFVLALMARSFLVETEPVPPLSLATEAFGCFVHSVQDRIVIDKLGFRLEPSEMEPVNYELVATKSGLRIQIPGKVIISQDRGQMSHVRTGSDERSLAVQTKLDTAVLVDGIWITASDGTSRLFERRPIEECTYQ